MSFAPRYWLSGMLLLLAGGLVATPATAQEASESAAEPVVLRWKARKENQVYGYLVYRSDDREGPFLRVSRRILRVPAGADTEQAHEYTFTDSDVEAGQTYYYYLDMVSNSGRKRRFSGVISKQAEPASTADQPDGSGDGGDR